MPKQFEVLDKVPDHVTIPGTNQISRGFTVYLRYLPTKEVFGITTTMAGVTRNLGNAVWSQSNPTTSVSYTMEQAILAFLEDEAIATCVPY